MGSGHRTAPASRRGRAPANAARRRTGRSRRSRRWRWTPWTRSDRAGTRARPSPAHPRRDRGVRGQAATARSASDRSSSAISSCEVQWLGKAAMPSRAPTRAPVMAARVTGSPGRAAARATAAVPSSEWAQTSQSAAASVVATLRPGRIFSMATRAGAPRRPSAASEAGGQRGMPGRRAQLVEQAPAVAAGGESEERVRIDVGGLDGEPMRMRHHRVERHRDRRRRGMRREGDPGGPGQGAAAVRRHAHLPPGQTLSPPISRRADGRTRVPQLVESLAIRSERTPGAPVPSDSQRAAAQECLLRRGGHWCAADGQRRRPKEAGRQFTADETMRPLASSDAAKRVADGQTDESSGSHGRCRAAPGRYPSAGPRSDPGFGGWRLPARRRRAVRWWCGSWTPPSK